MDFWKWVDRDEDDTGVWNWVDGFCGLVKKSAAADGQYTTNNTENTSEA